MKKWLIGCLTVLAMVCLIPGIALNAKAESLYCRNCDKFTDCEILGYKKYDSSFHTLHIKCKSCKMENDVIDSKYSSHEWSKWETLSGMILHGHSCNRCDYYITEVCTGGTATCTAKAVCVVCGGEYGKLAPHQLVTIDRPATCQKEGLKYTYCAACRYRTPNIITPIQPHDLKKAREFTREPTCTKPGWKSYYSCRNCAYSETDWLDKLGHDLKQYAAKAPTCTEIGWEAYEACSRCNYTTRKELPALKHDLVQHDAQAPTCTEKGWAYETCSRSGCNYITRKELPALKHDLKQHAAKAPTCTDIGWDAYDTCSRSGCNYTTYQEKAALKHDLVHHDAQAPTCTGIGWNAYETCTRCDHTTYAELPALNHALVQHDAQAPTCTEIGWDAYETCSRCNYTTYAELPALKHDLVHHDAQAATCTKPGWNAYETCSRCDYTTYTELSALNHDLVRHDAKAATCTEIGWNAYDTCSRCDYTTYAEQPALNHDLVQHDAKAPTCTGIGWDAYETCSRCDYTTYAELPALNHDLVRHEAKATTCTEIGWDAYDTCSRSGCNYTTYQEIPALKHALVQHAAQAPTCTEKGWNAYDTCSRCNYTTYAELPALNHDLEQHDAKAPTCTEIGWDAYDTCSRCDYTTYAELPALNHDYQAVTVDPTCEADGYTIFTCSRCKDSYTADPTDKLGHQFGAWSPNETGSQSAGCLRQGCVHIGSTDCRKFTFRTAENETLTFCPVCGQAENAAQLEKIDAATAWARSGSLSAADVTARTNGEYLSVAFETAGSLTQPTGRVRLALPAGLLEGKKLVRIAPDGTQTELPFEAKNGKRIYTLDFANSALPVMLFRLVPQTAAL